MTNIYNNLSIEHAYRKAASLLTESDSSVLDAQLLLLAALDKSDRVYLMTYPEVLLTLVQAEAFQALINRRLQGEPIAHILGEREFWGLTLKVNASTLIPRPDTETLIETVLQLYQANDPQIGTHISAHISAHIGSHTNSQAENQINSAFNVLDLGTGTGAIALALKSEYPNWQVHAVEYNPDAFQLAKINSRALQLPIQLYLGSWFEPLNKVDTLFDLIVSNPPYIDSLDPHLIQGDVQFEPKSALVASKSGIADIEHIIKAATHHLKVGGYLMFEHGYQQAQIVRDLFELQGYQSIQTVQDLGGNDRVTFAQRAIPFKI